MDLFSAITTTVIPGIASPQQTPGPAPVALVLVVTEDLVPPPAVSGDPGRAAAPPGWAGASVAVPAVRAPDLSMADLAGDHGGADRNGHAAEPDPASRAMAQAAQRAWLREAFLERISDTPQAMQASPGIIGEAEETLTPYSDVLRVFRQA